jgi:hypothetical protein
MKDTLNNKFMNNNNKRIVFLRSIEKSQKRNKVNNSLNDISIYEGHKQKYKSTVFTDLYFNLIYQLHTKFNEVHFVNIKKHRGDGENCVYYDCSKINKELIKDKVYIWYVPTIEMFNLFKGDTLFLRGDYGCFDDFSKNFNRLILYRAGTLSAKKRKYDRKVSLYLYDDLNSKSMKNAIKRFGQWSNFCQFVKPCVKDEFCFLNLEKRYDLICIAKATSCNNNYKLFFDFLEWLGKKELKNKIKIYTCGYKEQKALDYLSEIKNKFEDKFELEIDNRISSKLLSKKMNFSKVAFIPTIKDGNPRIIGQLLKCGVYSICSNLLEGGKDQLTSELGEIIEYNNKFNQQLLNNISKNYNHKRISEIAETKFNGIELSKNIISVL